MSASPAAAPVTAPRVVFGQVRHQTTAFWRTPIAAFFTIVFPLMFLLLIGAIAGNEVVDPDSGLRLAQFLTPSMAVFGTAIAAFTSIAIAVAEDRERGVLKRLRSTPLPAWAYLAGRVLTAAWTALIAVVILVVVGVAFYGVQVVWVKVPAAVVTLAVAVAALAALGLAVASLVDRSETVGVVTNGLLIPVAFISGVFVAGDVPGWLDRIATILPLKHIVEALAETFNPYTAGAGFSWDHLAVVAAWGVGGALVALRRFRWEPVVEQARPGAAGTGSKSAGEGASDGTAPPRPAVAVAPRPVRVDESGRPGRARLIVAQLRHAVTAVARDRSTVAFTVFFPVVLVLLLPQVFGTGELPDRGVTLPQYLTAVLAVYGLASAAYSDLAGRVARARERGILKRVHGTPLPLSTYVAGQLGATVLLALVVLVVCVTAGAIAYDVRVVWEKVPALLVYLTLGVGCATALGMAVSALARDADSANTIANATLLPLAFASDIFIIGNLPPWLDAIGWAFPLKPLANGVADTFDPTTAGLGFHAGYVLSLAVWLVIGVVLAVRGFRWEPRPSGGASGRRWRRRTPPAVDAVSDDEGGRRRARARA